MPGIIDADCCPQFTTAVQTSEGHMSGGDSVSEHSAPAAGSIHSASNAEPESGGPDQRDSQPSPDIQALLNAKQAPARRAFVGLGDLDTPDYERNGYIESEPTTPGVLGKTGSRLSSLSKTVSRDRQAAKHGQVDTIDTLPKPKLADKLAATVQQIKGILTHDEALKEQGRSRKHGEGAAATVSAD